VEHFWIPLVAAFASLLTFFTGFGLGTLLTPVFALFFPIALSVALTAVVHLLNGLFKLFLIGRHADRNVVIRFGIPAIFAAFMGAWLLSRLSTLPVITTYTLATHTYSIVWVKLVIAALMIFFTVFELVPTYATYRSIRNTFP
jgi:uncharacterized membrane protein YfcA